MAGSALLSTECTSQITKWFLRGISKERVVLTGWSDWKGCQSLDKQSHSYYTLTNPCHHTSPPLFVCFKHFQKIQLNAEI